MAKILEMPKLSPTMEEGVLAVWHKKEGDKIAVDDLLGEVETDKATMEFRAFDSGTLLKLLVPAGSDVKLGQPVAILGQPGEDISALLNQASANTSSVVKEAPKSEPEKASAPAAPAVSPPPTTEARTPMHKARSLDRTEQLPEPVAKKASSRENVIASPFVRKAARDRGIDLSQVSGSGPRGRIVASDLGASAKKSSSVNPSSRASETRPLSQMRKTIARRLSESKQTVPHFYLNIDTDAGALVDLREAFNADTAKRAERDGEKPTKISINDLIIKAVALALKEVPECNAQFRSDAIVVHHRVDISVAVAVAEGLVTPVIRDADTKSVTAIAREVRELAARAKSKKLTPEEMSDGTFSISNLGMFGIDSFSAVINPPEGAILAVGQVRDEPVVRAGQVTAGKKLALTLSCDHRVIDGAVGAQFLAALRARIETPARMFWSDA